MFTISSICVLIILPIVICQMPIQMDGSMSTTPMQFVNPVWAYPVPQQNCYTICYPTVVAMPVPVPAPLPVSTCPAAAPPLPLPSPIAPITADFIAPIPAEPLEPVLKKKNFTVNFDLGNFPLDVYYLMDASASMSDDKENLVKLSPNLIDTIKDLSSDFQIGFGSFVDKPVYPFGRNDLPTHDYSFWNQIPLTNDPSGFTSTVSKTQILDGDDDPEGTLDALFQVAACTSKIGWRKSARHVVLVTTDADYHKAGDGAAVALKAFDGKCHLSNSGRYTEEATMDYPSVDQVKEVVQENQITVIFAVTPESNRFYEDIAETIKTSKLAVLTKDSSNIIDLLKETYNEISSTIEIESTRSRNDIKVVFYSKCSGYEDIKTNKCTLPANSKVSFNVEVEMKCPIDATGYTLTVNPVGIPTAKNIDLSSVCL